MDYPLVTPAYACAGRNRHVRSCKRGLNISQTTGTVWNISQTAYLMAQSDSVAKFEITWHVRFYFSHVKSMGKNV